MSTESNAAEIDQFTVKMHTPRMTSTNGSGTISMTAHHRENQRRFQITIQGAYSDTEMITSNRAMYVDVDAETIANMQRVVDKYRELYPDLED